MPTEDLLLRPAEPSDAEAVAALHLAARHAAHPLMPAPVHPDDEVLAHVAESVRSGSLETWLAENGSGLLLGYAALTPTWLDALYVAPAHQGRGVGSALLGLVLSLRPDGLGLWVFASNSPARAFYLRHGLTEEETTDGRDNEERRPDVRMSWAGAVAAGRPGRRAGGREPRGSDEAPTDRFLPTPNRGK